ncbi:MAG TPA: hypothetical protein VMA32_12280 [Streptosporangiaceae bacterium]|nr:hypothetical protein [Streptosporangiaceae bacterium]
MKVLMRPRDERMRELISPRAFGLSEIEAVRYYVALKMAERSWCPACGLSRRWTRWTSVCRRPGSPRSAR